VKNFTIKTQKDTPDYGVSLSELSYLRLRLRLRFGIIQSALSPFLSIKNITRWLPATTFIDCTQSLWIALPAKLLAVCLS